MLDASLFLAVDMNVCYVQNDCDQMCLTNPASKDLQTTTQRYDTDHDLATF